MGLFSSDNLMLLMIAGVILLYLKADEYLDQQYRVDKYKREEASEKRYEEMQRQMEKLAKVLEEAELEGDLKTTSAAPTQKPEKIETTRPYTTTTKKQLGFQHFKWSPVKLPSPALPAQSLSRTVGFTCRPRIPHPDPRSLDVESADWQECPTLDQQVPFAPPLPHSFFFKVCPRPDLRPPLRRASPAPGDVLAAPRGVRGLPASSSYWAIRPK